MSTAQVRITNTIRRTDGVLIPKVLSIKASELPSYLDGLVNEANGVYTPSQSKKFDHLPLLSLYDLADTGEEVFFTAEDLPTETVVNSKGAPILIIIPEEAEEKIGTNKLTYLSEKERGAYSKVLSDSKISNFKVKDAEQSLRKGAK